MASLVSAANSLPWPQRHEHDEDGGEGDDKIFHWVFFHG
jgi:hypothetical protein